MEPTDTLSYEGMDFVIQVIIKYKWRDFVFYRRLIAFHFPLL